MDIPSWSYSTNSNFENCRRLYFYEKYWQLAQDKWLVYKLKYMTNIPMLLGSNMHDVIKDALRHQRNGLSPMGLEEALALFGRKFRTDYNESSEGHWRNPKIYGKKVNNTINLFEHYYKMPSALEAAKSAEAKGISGLTNLWKSKLWEYLMLLPKESFVAIDEGNFPSFNFNDINIYAIIDLAFDYKGRNIIDWKTGKKSAVNQIQLAIYALFAEATWGWAPEDIVFRLVYTENTEIESIIIDKSNTEAAKEIINRSYSEMLALYNNGEPNIDNFPLTDNLSHCRNCKFKEVCNR